MGLSSSYPLAGRLGPDAKGKLEIDCNGEGLPFLVARSRLTADDFRDFKPSPRLRRLFVPLVDDSAGILCAIQVCVFLSELVILYFILTCFLATSTLCWYTTFGFCQFCM